MSTQSNIASTRAKINGNLKQISDLESRILSSSNSARQYEQLKSTCKGTKKKKEACRNSRENSVQQHKVIINSANSSINALKTQNVGLERKISSLQKDAQVERENSKTVTETLAQQGKTVESVESVADAKAQAEREKARVQAEVDSQIAIQTARTNQTLAKEQADADLKQDNNRNYLFLAVIVVIVIMAVLYFKNKIK